MDKGYHEIATVRKYTPIDWIQSIGVTVGSGNGGGMVGNQRVNIGQMLPEINKARRVC